MTRTQGNILAAVLLTLGLGTVLVPLLMALVIMGPLQAYPPLSYPHGVTFFQNSDGRFPQAAWSADDWDRPGRCALTVHLPTGDLDPAHLGSIDRLRQAGWTEEPKGVGVDLYSPGRAVECHFRHRALTSVRVDATKGVGPIAVSYRGGRVELPATADTITGTLGRPKE